MSRRAHGFGQRVGHFDVVSEKVPSRHVGSTHFVRCRCRACGHSHSGDKDFLESGITRPHIMMVREFVQIEEW